MVDKSQFYVQDDYFPLTVGGPAVSVLYNEHMFACQEAYAALVNVHKVPPEIARGVLPMHVNSRLVMGITLREFARLMGQRTCWIAQGSYWQPLIACMRSELDIYLGGELSDSIFQPPCQTQGTCIMPDEADNRLRGESPYEPCPLYTEEVKQASKAR